MHVFQTAGAPPNCGKTILAIIGCTQNSRNAPRKAADMNRSRMRHSLALSDRLIIAESPGHRALGSCHAGQCGDKAGPRTHSIAGVSRGSALITSFFAGVSPRGGQPSAACSRQRARCRARLALLNSGPCWINSWRRHYLSPPCEGGARGVGQVAPPARVSKVPVEARSEPLSSPKLRGADAPCAGFCHRNP